MISTPRRRNGFVPELRALYGELCALHGCVPLSLVPKS